MRYTEERYENSLKAFRDMKNTLDNAKKEGREETLIEIAKNLLEMKMPFETIMKATGLSMEEIVKLS